MKIYDLDYVGDVCVRVSDGKGGQSECCVAVDITAYQTKNIDVTNPDGPAVDLGIDPLTGDVNGDWLWIVEKNDCIASRWDVSSMVAWGNLVYDGPVFGTSGTPGDDDSSLNNPLDITTDMDGQMYVLDELSTAEFVVKAFTYDATSTTSQGSFYSSWDYDPIRIDGSSFNGNVIVLMTNGINSAISMFVECETP
ncbi:MAG TPA: hypothetical protein VGB30_13675 [bacterium]